MTAIKKIKDCNKICKKKTFAYCIAHDIKAELYEDNKRRKTNENAPVRWDIWKRIPL